MNTETIDENLVDIYFQEQSLALAKRKAKWNANRSIMAPIVNALAKLGHEPIVDSSDVNLYFSGGKKELAAVIRILRCSGFNTNAERPEKGKSSWTARFTADGCGMGVYLSFSSNVCVTKQVGTRMVEQPIYETVCGEDISTDETPLLQGQAPALTGHTDDAIENSGQEPEGLSGQS